MVNPLVIPAGKAALTDAVGGVATKIAASDKAAEAIGGAFKSIEETTKMGGFNELRGFSENIKNSGPVMGAWDVFMAKWKAAVISGNVELMTSLLQAFESPAVKEGMESAAITMNSITAGASSLAGLAELIPAGTIEKLGQFSRSLTNMFIPLDFLIITLEKLTSVIEKLLEYKDKLTIDVPFGTHGSTVPTPDDWTEPDPIRPGMQEF